MEMQRFQGLSSHCRAGGADPQGAGAGAGEEAGKGGGRAAGEGEADGGGGQGGAGSAGCGPNEDPGAAGTYLRSDVSHQPVCSARIMWDTKFRAETFH